MTTIFATILNMSLTASYCIAAVVVLRLLLKKQPKLLSYLLWSVVLFRLLCPVTISSSFSLLRMNTNMISQENLADRRTADAAVWQEDADVLIQDTGNQSAKTDTLAAAVQAERGAGARTQTLLAAGAWVWFAGMVLLIAYGIRSAYRLRRFLQKAVCVGEGIYEAEGLSSSFVYGVICPRIYLPAGLTAKERVFVLAHERVHAARKDYLVKLLAWLARCIHWFNPLAWLFFALMENDMEMSCDEAALRKLGMDVRQDYSRALVTLSCETSRIGSCPPAFGEGRVKDRVRNILSYRRRTAASVAVLVFVLTAVVIGLSLNPARQNRGAESPEELLRLGEKDALVMGYANAWCNRDGETLVKLYVDEDTAFANLPMLEKENGQYLFGYSSPWPIGFWRTIPTGEGKDKGTSEIRYYAWTSEPHITVWKEEITFEKTKNEADGAPIFSRYRVTDSELTYFDSVASGEEYMAAYFGDGEYHFADYEELGFVDSINYQTAYDMENGDSDRNAVYRSPETAAEHIFNLTGGRCEASYNSKGQSVVEYTFADGSSVLIPMIDANFDARTDSAAQDSAESDGQMDMAEAVNREVWILDLQVWNAGAP